MIINSIVTNVNEKKVTRRSDGVEITLYEVMDEQGTAWVARKDVAGVARALIGQPATWVTRTEQKGEYTNRYLDALEFNGGGAQPQVATQQAQQAQAGFVMTGNIPATQPSTSWANPQQAQIGPTEKDKQIHRQVAAKVAAELQRVADSQLDFWTNVYTLALYFDTGRMPTSVSEGVGSQIDASLNQAATYEPAPVHGDDDIPF